MFLTSSLVTFLAGLTLSANLSTPVVDQQGGFLTHLRFHCNAGDIIGTEHQATITYTGTDSHGNSYSVNLFYCYLHINNVDEANIVYGYNSTNNNTAFGGYISSEVFGQLTLNYTTEYLDTSKDYEIDISQDWYDYSSPLTEQVDFDLWFTLIDEPTFALYNDNQSIYNNGYDNGFSDGKEAGYGNGYQVGFAEARDQYENQSSTVNSIFSGILSIGLIPLEFFMSIFNFSILGVNVTSIISAILSLMVIVILLRIVLGGKSGKE